MSKVTCNRPESWGCLDVCEVGESCLSIRDGKPCRYSTRVSTVKVGLMRQWDDAEEADNGIGWAWLECERVIGCVQMAHGYAIAKRSRSAIHVLDCVASRTGCSAVWNGPSAVASGGQPDGSPGIRPPICSVGGTSGDLGPEATRRMLESRSYQNLRIMFPHIHPVPTCG